MLGWDLGALGELPVVDGAVGYDPLAGGLMGRLHVRGHDFGAAPADVLSLVVGEPEAKQICVLQSVHDGLRCCGGLL